LSDPEGVGYATLGVLPDGMIICATGDGHLVKYSADLSAVLFDHPLSPSGLPFGPAIDSTGNVYLSVRSSSNGEGPKVLALSSSGQLLSQYLIAEPPTLLSPPSLDSNGTLYVTSGGSVFYTGKLYAFPRSQ
jgi:outer membrane protein assembly factor BamB